MTEPHSQGGDEHPYLRLRRTEHEALFYRFVDDVVNEGRLEVVDDLVSHDVVMHVAGDPVPIRGPEAVKASVRRDRTAFPDLSLEVDDLVVDGPEVVGRLTMTGTHEGPFAGIEPTGVHVEVQRVVIDRIENGTLVERWELLDTHHLRRQLGATEPPGDRRRDRRSE